jgi:hypothetical protein
MKNIVNLSLLTIILFAGYVVNGQNYNLKYKYKKGKTYHYSLATVSNSTMEMMGQERQMKSASDQQYSAKIEKVNQGKFTILSKVDKMQLSFNLQGKDTVMQIPDMIGMRTRLTLLPDGRSTDIVKIDTLKNEMMQRMMQQSSGLSLHFMKLPGKIVKTGDSWDYSGIDSTYDSQKNLVETATKTRYMFEKPEMKNGHNSLKISYTSTITTKGKTIMQGMEMFRDGSGNSKGVYWFDPKAGIVVGNESETNMDVTIALSGQASMTIPVTAIEKQTYLLVE